MYSSPLTKSNPNSPYQPWGCVYRRIGNLAFTFEHLLEGGRR
jgi:hypothetical protein